MRPPSPELIRPPEAIAVEAQNIKGRLKTIFGDRTFLTIAAVGLAVETSVYIARTFVHKPETKDMMEYLQIGTGWLAIGSLLIHMYFKDRTLKKMDRLAKEAVAAVQGDAATGHESEVMEPIEHRKSLPPSDF